MDHSFVVGRGTVVSWRASKNFRAKRGPIPKLRGKGGSCKYTHVLVCVRVCVCGGGGGGGHSRCLRENWEETCNVI